MSSPVQNQTNSNPFALSSAEVASIKSQPQFKQYEEEEISNLHEELNRNRFKHSLQFIETVINDMTDPKSKDIKLQYEEIFKAPTEQQKAKIYELQKQVIKTEPEKEQIEKINKLSEHIFNSDHNKYLKTFMGR